MGIQVVLSINYPISIAIFVAIASSLIYYWLRLYRWNVLSSLYQMAVFLLMFASIVLWGETYFLLYRWTCPLFVIIVPPLYPALKAVSKRLQSSLKVHASEERIVLLALMPLLAVTVYGTVGFLIPLLSHDVLGLQDFIKWQFGGIAPGR
jgi:nitrate reductase NapE component